MSSISRVLAWCCRPRAKLRSWFSRNRISPPRTIRSGSRSPEDTRQRLREEADANADNPNYVSPLAKASANGRALTKSEQTQAYRDARKIQMGAYADKRRFLSDPPLEYRKLPEEATADLGEPEQVKERRRKKEAAIKGSGKKWYQIF